MSPASRSARRVQHAEQRLADELEESGLAGKRLHIPSLPFTVSSAAVMSALMSGPPRRLLRRQRIETGIEELLARAGAEWRRLARRHAGQPARFARLWTAWVDGVDTRELNRLIAAHNEWYPVEANLPLNVRTGAYMTPDGSDYRYEPITPAWLLARFPAEPALAGAGTEPYVHPRIGPAGEEPGDG